jgi:AcrR family transcriptional regulator
LKYSIGIEESEGVSVTMQVQKINIRRTILQAARCEFLKKGFKEASMRAIARQSGITLSNIYNYFRSKDEIFRAVLKPLLEEVGQKALNPNSGDYLTTDVFTMKSYQQKMLDDFRVIIKRYRPELKLLLFRANGSSLGNFRDTFTDKHTLKGMEYMRRMKAKYPGINSEISEFFIHIMSLWWLTVVGEIVSHDELTGSQIEQFLAEYIAFGTAGWKELMKV